MPRQPVQQQLVGGAGARPGVDLGSEWTMAARWSVIVHSCRRCLFRNASGQLRQLRGRFATRVPAPAPVRPASAYPGRGMVKVGLVLGAGGVLGGAWLTGALDALARETEWDPGSADHIVGTSAGSMIGALVASGVPPWFMVAHSRGEVFDGLTGPDGRPAADADRSAGAVFRIHRGLPWIGPGSLRMAFTALRNPLRHTPLQMLAGWLPAGIISTDSLQELVRRAIPGDWVEHPNYWAVACDYRSGRRIPFGRIDAPRAEIAEAVAASCAIPGFYRPVRIGGRRYVDGGVCSISNLDLVAGRGLDLVICLNPLTSSDRDDGLLDLLPVLHERQRQAPAGARGAQGAPLRQRGARDRADRRGPRRDGAQLDERRAPPAGDRDRAADGRGAAAGAGRASAARVAAGGRAAQDRAAAPGRRRAGPSCARRSAAAPPEPVPTRPCGARGAEAAQSSGHTTSDEGDPSVERVREEAAGPGVAPGRQRQGARGRRRRQADPARPAVALPADAAALGAQPRRRARSRWRRATRTSR